MSNFLPSRKPLRSLTRNPLSVQLCDRHTPPGANTRVPDCRTARRDSKKGCRPRETQEDDPPDIPRGIRLSPVKFGGTCARRFRNPGSTAGCYKPFGMRDG